MLRFAVYQSLLIILLINLILAQLHFEENVRIDKKKANLAGRLPLYSPSRCKTNELFYPGDQEDDWICDCAPASIYYPETEQCYKAFRQGPCEADQFLVLFPNKSIPECISNACKIDGQIRINNRCYQLGEHEPCKNPELSYVLGVDPVTLKVDCVLLSFTLATRFSGSTPPTSPEEPASEYDWSKLDLCAKGTKRYIRDTCPEL